MVKKGGDEEGDARWICVARIWEVSVCCLSVAEIRGGWWQRDEVDDGKKGEGLLGGERDGLRCEMVRL